MKVGSASKARARDRATQAAVGGGLAVGAAFVFGVAPAVSGVVVSIYVYCQLRRRANRPAGSDRMHPLEVVAG